MGVGYDLDLPSGMSTNYTAGHNIVQWSGCRNVFDCVRIANQDGGNNENEVVTDNYMAYGYWGIQVMSTNSIKDAFERNGIGPEVFAEDGAGTWHSLMDDLTDNQVTATRVQASDGTVTIDKWEGENNPRLLIVGATSIGHQAYPHVKMSGGRSYCASNNGIINDGSQGAMVRAVIQTPAEVTLEGNTRTGTAPEGVVSRLAVSLMLLRQAALRRGIAG